jgi:hypothetical protein
MFPERLDEKFGDKKARQVEMAGLFEVRKLASGAGQKIKLH